MIAEGQDGFFYRAKAPVKTKKDKVLKVPKKQEQIYTTKPLITKEAKPVAKSLNIDQIEEEQDILYIKTRN